MSLPCHHCFCEECIFRALEIKALCPICKAPTKRRKLRHDTMIQQLLVASDLLSVGITPPMPSPVSIAKTRPPAQPQHQQAPGSQAPTAAMPHPQPQVRAPSQPPPMPTAAENDAVVAATEQQEYLPNGPFTVGQLVQVASRTWPGINKLGGTAWIMDVCNDGTYNVKYVIDSRREHSVHDYWIQKASEDIISDATPSRAVKRRQRRPSRSPGADSDEFASLISFSNGSGVSTGSIRSKKQKVRYQGKAFTDSGASMVLLCSGFNNETMAEIERWVDVLDARIVFEWSCEVTHLIVKCTITQAQSESDDDVEYVNEEAFRPSSPNGRRLSDQDSATPKRWVNIRSLKYLKALVAGRWIVSEEWLQACFSHGGYVSETLYEADGHMKGQSIDSAVRRSRKTRESNIAAAPSSVNPSTIGTKLFEGLVFHVTGEFLSPMPPAREIEVLLQLGDGTLISSLSDAAAEMAKPENSGRRLVIVCDKINPASHKQMVRHIERLPELHAVANKAVVSYQWVLNSISEARVRPL
ncbi:TPA: hypothetical protein N0F65_005169 [Lagenidium giganteum]|uniref:Uncharacterized protein n=1 Tax=Lagenidium giganteum TaxID=4803 RepID=A0AAV2YZS2_9STRA|nr:TPA: hypothetical protein N0F65_005169 [Lagenidium giganteum]